jgi:hypothetical protein
MHAHEKRQEQMQREQERSFAEHDEQELRRRYEEERAVIFKDFLASPEGRQKYNETLPLLLDFYRATEPTRFHEAAHAATVSRIERMDFRFPDYPTWVLTRKPDMPQPSI